MFRDGHGTNAIGIGIVCGIYASQASALTRCAVAQCRPPALVHKSKAAGFGYGAAERIEPLLVCWMLDGLQGQ